MATLGNVAVLLCVAQDPGWWVKSLPREPLKGTIHFRTRGLLLAHFHWKDQQIGI